MRRSCPQQPAVCKSSDLDCDDWDEHQQDLLGVVVCASRAATGIIPALGLGGGGFGCAVGCSAFFLVILVVVLVVVLVVLLVLVLALLNPMPYPTPATHHGLEFWCMVSEALPRWGVSRIMLLLCISPRLALGAGETGLQGTGRGWRRRVGS